MITTNNITTTTMNMNIYNNTDQTINANMDIPTKVCSKCRTIKYVTEFTNVKQLVMVIIIPVEIVLIIETKNIMMQ